MQRNFTVVPRESSGKLILLPAPSRRAACALSGPRCFRFVHLKSSLANNAPYSLGASAPVYTRRLIYARFLAARIHHAELPKLLFHGAFALAKSTRSLFPILLLLTIHAPDVRVALRLADNGWAPRGSIARARIVRAIITRN